MSTELAQKKCLPCTGGIPPLTQDQIKPLLAQIEGWKLNCEGHLERVYIFKNFKEGFEFVKRIGDMAENQGHHPDIFLAWGKVRLEVWTHKIGGLTESDFVFAAKADGLLRA